MTRHLQWIAHAVCLFLAALVWAVFSQTLGFEFVNYDDGANVYDNPEVTKGLTLGGLFWAFSHTQVGHWDPVTTVSHMLDSQLFGLRPGPHHLGNVLLHGATAILLFLALWRMTSALWRSAFVAAVFAVHPLRVESVAWVTERKDVLSGVFFMLTLAAYARYVRHPHSPARYAAVLILFALGLMSKSMLVTLPFVMLLLDYWPLGRSSAGSPWRSLFREKIPLFSMAALYSIIQLVADKEGLVTTEKIPLLARLTNALVSYAAYIGQMFYPAHLVVFYPHPENSLPASQIALAILLLLGISAAALALRKKQPWLVVGWLWYLGMLVPVIGLVQSGELARADRYTYLPQIGLSMALTWAVAGLCGRRLHLLLLAPLAGMVIATLAVTAHRQTAHWHDSTALWHHTLDCNPDNVVAHENLGSEFDHQGRLAEALAQHRRAVEIKPDYEIAQNNLGLDLYLTGQGREAIPHFQKALAIKPHHAQAHNNLANVLMQNGQLDEAIAHYRQAIESKPDFAGAEANLGNALIQTGHTANAIVHYERALEIQPAYAKAHANLASALLQTGRNREALAHLQTAVHLQPDYALAHANLASALLATGAPQDAIVHFQRALDLQPRFPAVQNNLAWLLATHPDATLRDGPRAVTLAEQALEAATDKSATVLRTLAAAYAEAGRFPAAIQTTQRALQMPEASTTPALGEALRTQLALYQSGSPFHEPPALPESLEMIEPPAL